MGDHSRLSLAIAQLAARQLGQVTRAQLLALGASNSWISRALRGGRLVRMYPGVYAVGYRRVDRHAVAMAAVLRCGPSALLSHGSAAWLWEFGDWPRKHEVTIAGDRRPSGIVVHRSRTLTADDQDRQLGIPVTSPERTLRDIRSRLDEERFRRAVSDA